MERGEQKQRAMETKMGLKEQKKIGLGECLEDQPVVEHVMELAGEDDRKLLVESRDHR